MSAASDNIEELKAAVVKQGDLVKRLKGDKAVPKERLEAEVDALKALKKQLDEKSAGARQAMEAEEKRAEARKLNFEELLKRKFFVIPSFEIYGGVGGLYDFGPPGCAIMMNLQSLWRRHFVLHEDMLEISGPAMTPEIVLKASGHVDKFSDFMVRDEKKPDLCYRADKLLENHVEKMLKDVTLSAERVAELKAILAAAGSYREDELRAKLRELKVVAPDTGNQLTDPFPFNLMFQTQIGPTGKFIGYLRPETAQGIFVNFRRLLDYNSDGMPFAAAQIGPAFRNEIAPRAGLLRVREFTLAEIEHFVHPDKKDHPKFKQVAHLTIPLLPRELQDGSGRMAVMTVGEAVKNKVIKNETLAYFLARTMLFLHKAGINPEKLRFRQHRSDEMAHYAADCWDAEIYISSYGWIECVGHADRSAFDLRQHSDWSKKDLTARERIEEKEVEVHELNIEQKLIGKKFGKKANDIKAYFEKFSRAEADAFQAALAKGPQKITVNDEQFEIDPPMFSVTITKTKINSVAFVPHVIEPSFGLGRIIYAILEHAFNDTKWGDDKRVVLELKPVMAPFKAGLISLTNTDRQLEMLEQLRSLFVDAGITTKVDGGSAAPGRKYARMDEVGTPFCVTVDVESEKDGCVTIRDRDTTKQIRVPIAQSVEIISKLANDKLSWADAYNSFPHFEFQA